MRCLTDAKQLFSYFKYTSGSRSPMEKLQVWWDCIELRCVQYFVPFYLISPRPPCLQVSRELLIYKIPPAAPPLDLQPILRFSTYASLFELPLLPLYPSLRCLPPLPTPSTRRHSRHHQCFLNLSANILSSQARRCSRRTPQPPFHPSRLDCPQCIRIQYQVLRHHKSTINNCL